MTVGLKTRKPLTSKGFSYQCLFLIIVVCTGLFANTKLTKNRTKYIRVHINVACDVSEVTHRCTDVHRDEVARSADVQSFLGFAQGLVGFLQGLMVTCVGDNRFFLDLEITQYFFDQLGLQF